MEISRPSIREITGPDDPLWPDWLGTYLASFPEHERMSEGFFREVLNARQEGADTNRHILVEPGEDATETAACIALYETDADTRSGLLWYLATRPGLRGAGIGARMYRHIREQSRVAGADLLLFEVDTPACAALRSVEEGEWASRRIAWYRRQGAKLLQGVQYFQGVDTTDALTEMHLMADPFEPLSAAEVFDKAKRLFGDSLTQVGPISLD